LSASKVFPANHRQSQWTRIALALAAFTVVYARAASNIRAAEDSPFLSRTTVSGASPSLGLGVVAKIGQDPVKDDLQLNLIRQLGARVVLLTPGEWATNESVAGRYALTPEIRRVVAEITASKLSIVVLLFRANKLYPNPLDPTAFARYAAWTAAVFKDAPVVAYQIWNEPSNFDFLAQYGGSWNGRGSAPWLDAYSELVRQAAAAIRQTNPHATIMANIEGPAWIYAMQRHAPDFVALDGIALHPYTFRLPAESVPWGGFLVELRDGVSSADSDQSLTSYVRIAGIDGPEKYLGHSLQPFVTEYGFPTCGPATTHTLYACVSAETQAAYHARGVILGLSHGIKLWTVFELADEGENPSDAEQNFGIVRSASRNYTPKPAYFALQRIARLLNPDWAFLPTPAATVETQLDAAAIPAWSPLPAARSTVQGVQAFWFATRRGYAVFLWNAGPYEDNSKISGRLVWNATQAKPKTVRTLNLVTGQLLTPGTQMSNGQLIAGNLQIGSQPIAVECDTGS
jgi:Cellulase (glycosyl hydrolase family 5)